jgi:hypothetical protein
MKDLALHFSRTTLSNKQLGDIVFRVFPSNEKAVIHNKASTRVF